jgi:hypothetical protein
MVEINHQHRLCFSLPSHNACFFSELNAWRDPKPVLAELQRRVTSELQVWLCTDTSNVVWSYM